MTNTRISTNKRYLVLITGSLVGLSLFIWVAWWVVSEQLWLKEYASFTRPDRHYRIVVRRTSMWPAFIPGQASDASGTVQLYNRNGKLLQETTVDMVQLVERVDWTERKV